MPFLTLNNILMGTKALSLKDKEIQRAEPLQDKNPLLLKNFEKIHTDVYFFLR